jgi:chemotaxis signal transduction protein
MTGEANHQASPPAQVSERRTLLLFEAGARRFCLFADEAYSAVEWREPVPLPRAPQAILGVVSLRGRMFTVIDIGALFGDLETGAKDESPAVQAPHGFIIPLRGDEQLALTASAEPRAVETFLDQLGPMPEAEGLRMAARALFRGEDEEASILLDPGKIFPLAMRGSERRRRRF